MNKFKQSLMIAGLGLRETFTDTKMVIPVITLGFIYDNGVYAMLNNARLVGAPLGMFEAFIMCMNHWYYVVPFLMAFVFFYLGLPRVNTDYIFFVQRIGKISWLFGEVFHVLIVSFVYLGLLFGICIAGISTYSFTGNVWSNFTLDYELAYKSELAGSNLYVDSQVFRYGFPFDTAANCFFLMLLCMLILGTIVLLFSVINKKTIGILIDIIFIGCMIVFSEFRSPLMWISPVSHSVITIHHVYIFKKMMFPLLYSYIYLIGLETALVFVGCLLLKRKNYW